MLYCLIPYFKTGFLSGIIFHFKTIPSYCMAGKLAKGFKCFYVSLWPLSFFLCPSLLSPSPLPPFSTDSVSVAVSLFILPTSFFSCSSFFLFFLSTLLQFLVPSFQFLFHFCSFSLLLPFLPSFWCFSGPKHDHLWECHFKWCSVAYKEPQPFTQQWLHHSMFNNLKLCVYADAFIWKSPDNCLVSSMILYKTLQFLNVILRILLFI